VFDTECSKGNALGLTAFGEKGRILRKALLGLNYQIIGRRALVFFKKEVSSMQKSFIWFFDFLDWSGCSCYEPIFFCISRVAVLLNKIGMICFLEHALSIYE
jgi:hypothetical protein